MIGGTTEFFYGKGAQSSSSFFGSYNNHDMKEIWGRTRAICEMGAYATDQGVQHVDHLLVPSIEGTFKRISGIWRQFIILLFGKTFSSRGFDTKIEVKDRDALEEAVSLKQAGYKVALLNPANARDPGGGYKSGARAMEEDICRRSGLAFAIDPAQKKVQNRYPLNGDELLYTPDMPIFRHGKDRAYAYMDTPVTVSVVTSAAIDLNPWHKADRAFQRDETAFREETERRIYAQLAVSAEEGNDAVVLTAFGCGAFRNSPETVAKIYKKVIDTHFQGVFKKITFAVINDHNTGYKHNPSGNFKPFQQVFGS